MYYTAKIKFESFDENTNRTRKIHEQYLVEAYTVSEAEEKLKNRFKDSIADVSVVSVQESKILGVIE